MTNNNHLNLIDGRDFFAFAGQSIEKWTALNGSYLFDSERGSGYITKIDPRDEHPLITIQFDGLEEQSLFIASSFNIREIRVSLPQIFEGEFSLWIIKHDEYKRALKKKRDASKRASKKRQELKSAHQAEMANRKREVISKYSTLIKKFKVPEQELFKDGEETQLGPILEKLQSKDALDEKCIEWLELQNSHRIIAIYFYIQYKKNYDLWQLVKTCKYLRRASLSNDAIKLSTGIENGNLNPRAWSALQTTRGGAFRDERKFTEAKDAANIAIKSYPNSYYPHMLLGAVSYDEGEFNEGDKHYHRAEKLGATEKMRKFEIISTLKNSSYEKREQLVKHLLSVDEDRYSWAKTYAT